MIDVIILAGGRGRRLGALTLFKQKGALRFKGKPILTQVIESILPLNVIGTIWVATGYRGEDVRSVLQKHHADLLLHKKITILGAPHISGELSRFAYAIRQIPTVHDCLVTGIDTLLPAVVFHRLIQRSRGLGNKTVLMAASRRLSIAPTHCLMRTLGDIVKTYECPNSVPIKARDSRYVDVGTRYFPADILQELRNLDVPHGTDPDDFLRGLIKQGKKIHAVVFEESWRHFATGRDFV